MEKRPGSSEEIIFTERGMLWPHPYQLMQHLRSVSYGFVAILYSMRLILLYSNHLEGRQTVENHLVHMGTRRTHVMTSSISILVRFFAEAWSVCENRENLRPAKFPAIRYVLCSIGTKEIRSEEVYCFLAFSISHSFCAQQTLPQYAHCSLC